MMIMMITVVVVVIFQLLYKCQICVLGIHIFEIATIIATHDKNYHYKVILHKLQTVWDSGAVTAVDAVMIHRFEDSNSVSDSPRGSNARQILLNHCKPSYYYYCYFIMQTTVSG